MAIAAGLCFGLRFSLHGHRFADVRRFVDDQDPVEVVDFVLKAAREQTVGFEPKFLAALL